jgi:hypothetical protein
MSHLIERLRHRGAKTGKVSVTFRVNPTSQKVLMTIVKNDGNWGVKDLFLDKCTVV